VLAAAFAAGEAAGATGLFWPLAGLILQTAAVFGLGLIVAPLATLYPDLRPAAGDGPYRASPSPARSCIRSPC
jgi:ABC-type polysaccharide/polyol phosphate export permease